MKNRDTKFNNKNKTALITGAAGLLGVQHCKALLDIETSVVMTDLNNDILKDIKKNLIIDGYDKNKIHCFQMDITNEKSIKDIADHLEKQNTHIDILVNNAAVNPTTSSIENDIRVTRLENFLLEKWNHEISVGLTGCFLCSKIFGTKMAEYGSGVILNISSDLSVIAPDQRIYMKKNLKPELQAVKPITYSVIKTGVIGLTRYLASYWADKGVRSNALSPGGVFANQDKDFVSNLEDLIPLGRMANSDEYVSAIQFLCSDASKYMNGHNLVIDGGRSII